jgi:Protein of unknown function (DUF1203)
MEIQPGVTIKAIPSEHLREVRDGIATSSGPAAHGAERSVATGGEPLRCCLRDARPGEPIILFSYRPPLPNGSVYQETGPVFAHASVCPGPDGDSYPADWLTRPQVLRAYTLDGRIHPGSRVHDGTDPVAAVEAVLDTEDVAVVHSRNIVYGCYMFSAHRADLRSPARAR